MDSRVRLVVYDLLGREIAILADGRYPAGKYDFTFDGSNVSSGVYFCRLSGGTSQITRRMMLLK
ncbi:MAG TPA: T9SS type A sorting domain-containing protein [Bacteroidota bacterium]|nr:T9SS type A sorting domain-containing protein [Bacteroidota bacterium]